MSEDEAFEAVERAEESKPDPLAAAISLVRSSDHRAMAYLEKQSRLVDLQIENLQKLDEYELSHLRWRRFSDRMRGGFQIMTMTIGALVALALLAVIWSAHNAKGLVVQPLRTPPDFAARGLDGTVLAQRLLDKLNGLVAESEPFAFRSAGTIGGDWGDDSKVEIPETGVSASQLMKDLRAWLGDETRTSGEIWRTASGIVVTVRAGSNVGATIAGPESDLDKLLDRAAENLLAQTQPYRYAAVLLSRGEMAQTLAFVMPIARSGSREDRAWAYAFWGNTLTFLGDNRGAFPPIEESIRLDPDDPSPYYVRGGMNLFLGHDEADVIDSKIFDRMMRDSGPSKISRAAAAAMTPLVDEVLCRILGDIDCAIDNVFQMKGQNWFGFDRIDVLLATLYADKHDDQAAREVLAQHPKWDDSTAVLESPYTDVSMPSFFVLVDEQQWTRAAEDAETVERRTRGIAVVRDVRHTFLWPWQAYALAMMGELKTANGLIAITPLDCNLCLRMRGRIAAIEGDNRSASQWFGRAEKQAPSITYAPTDWGRMLLLRGDYDGAISKFEEAHERGPHFADPLEMWGEALMRKNRSDLALEKFEEANKYAPRWGRLHMKWGEALWWTGDKQAAKQQFGIALSLDLSTSDKNALARVSHWH
jgi:tetratricopeptide (TPR) repeat protein